MSPMLVAIPPERLLAIAVIELIAATFVIGSGLVMAATGKPVRWLPAGQSVPPDRLRRAAVGVTLLGMGVALLAAGNYTVFANVESLPFFGAGLVVLLARPAGGGSKRFALVGFVVTLLSSVGLWWALSRYLHP